MKNYKKEINDEYYTPKYIFEAMDVTFDMDVSCPNDQSFIIHTPCYRNIIEKEDGLKTEWNGFVWMNPPYGREKDKNLWLDKFFKHGDGVALMPDRTSTKWWQNSAKNSDCFMQVCGKISFIRPDGSIASQPSNGTTLFAIGQHGIKALLNAEANGLGIVFSKFDKK